MYVPDFIIPLSRDELLNGSISGQCLIKEEHSIEEIRERLERAKTALNEEGTDFIVDHFSTYFWLLQKFKQCSQLVREKGWKVIRKAFTQLYRNLQALFEDSTNLDAEVQSKMCNITKMIVYALIELMKANQAAYIEQVASTLEGKARKKQAKVQPEEGDWNEEKHSVLVEIHTFLQLPFKLLWDPPVVEEEFINLIANFCCTCLEDPAIGNASAKYLRETIFQIMGVLIKSYLHGLSFCVKVVQLLRMNDHLVNPLAQGVVQLVTECDCGNIVREIVREVADTDGDQLAADTGGTRNLNLFLVHLAEAIPETILPAMDLLVSHLSGDSYSMRSCVVGVLGEIVLTVLTKPSLEEGMRKLRDEYLDSLEEHIHDVNAFVRTKALQIWQKLCLGKAIPVARMNRLLELVIGRLYDRSTNVKKQAVHLIKDLLEGNPFCGQLNAEDIRNQLQQERKKLEKIEKDHSGKEEEAKWREMEPKLKELLESSIEDFDVSDFENMPVEEVIGAVGQHLLEEDYTSAVAAILTLEHHFYNTYGMKKNGSTESALGVLREIFQQSSRPVLSVSPELQEQADKHSKAIEFLDSALEFSHLIDKALPVILTFLDSNAITDVLEAIHFFTAAYLFGFKQALEGVRKMLHLVHSKESSVRTAVSGAYRKIYFQESGSGRQQALATVRNLSELVLKLNFSQLSALEEVVKEWVKGEVIDKGCVQVMFERFSMKLPGTRREECWAALVLIRMVGAAEAKVVRSNLSVFVSEGLRSGSFLVGKETCRALQHLVAAREQGKAVEQTQRYPLDHDVVEGVYGLVRGGMWRVEEPYFIPMAEEAINLVFAICERPDEFCRNLIVDLHEGILSGKRPPEKNVSNANVLNRHRGELYLGDDEEGEEREEEEEEGGKERAGGEREEESKVEENPDELFITLLTRFISILGQVASNYILYLEGPVLNELKLRNQLEYERKLKKFEETKKLNISVKKSKKGGSENGAERNLNEAGSEDLEFNRVAADDMDAEEMRKKTENGVVTGKGFLAKYVPLVVAICKNPGKYGNRPLQNAALLALSKFMQVSSVCCEENLQLLVTICERSQFPERQENAMIALGALQYRFPNSLEPWTPHMYAMLQSPNPSVRYSSILVLTDLIVNEMVKVRSHIANLALCVVDKELRIARVARHFFREYAQKGNSLYNVLPSLISHLTQANSPLTPEEFKVVMRYILGLVTKERQSEYLVEKVCQYVESAGSERQWCDLAYCLSLLSHGDRGLRKILENVRCFANKLYLAEVYEAFCTIIADAGKNPQRDKALVDELSAIVKEYRDQSYEDKGVQVPERRGCPPSTRKRVVRRKYLPSDSEEEEVEKRARGGQQKRKNSSEEESNGEGEENGFLSDGSAKRVRGGKGGGVRVNGDHENDVSDEMDSDDALRKPSRPIRTRTKQTKKVKSHFEEAMRGSSDDDEGEEEQAIRKPVRNGRKRR